MSDTVTNVEKTGEQISPFLSFIGSLTNFCLKDVLGEPSGPVPELMFAAFQGMFAVSR